MENATRRIDGPNAGDANQDRRASHHAHHIASIRHLIQALTQPNAHAVAQAAGLLGAFGDAAKSAVPTLVKLARSDYVNIRASAVAALGHIAQYPAISIPALRLALSDEHSLVRQTAANAFRRFARRDLDTFDAHTSLVNALHDEDDVVCATATQALAQLTPRPASRNEGSIRNKEEKLAPA